MDFISVLMPVYNVSKYIQDAVKSILNQTYKYFELIIIDDCSTDDTFLKLSILAKEDPRIKIYKNEVNMGISLSLNKALSFATGNFIARMDGDDISDPLRFERQLQYLNLHQDIALIGTACRTIDENGVVLRSNLAIIDHSHVEKALSYTSPIVHPSWMGRRNIFEVLNGYRNISGVEDYDFLLRALSFGFKLSNLSICLFSLRIRSGNTISSSGRTQPLLKQYAYRLYRERKRLLATEDRFSEDAVLAIRMRQKNVKDKLYAVSMLLLTKASVRKSIFKRVLFSFLALCSSPFITLNYVYTRLLLKFFAKKDNMKEIT